MEDGKQKKKGMRAKDIILTVTLNPAVDKTMHVPDFRTGREYRVKGFSLSAGGKGINVSRALKGLGIGSIATGFLAGPPGEYIRENLKEEHIETDFVWAEGDTRTSLTIIDGQQKRTTRILEDGPVVSTKNILVFKRKYVRLLKKCRYVVLSGRNIPGAGDGFYGELVRLARKAGKPVVLDTSASPLSKGIKAKPFMIKPNLEEAEFLLGERLDSMVRLKTAVRRLLAQGVNVVVISLGSRGAVGSDGHEVWTAVPPASQAVNPVGSGDALIAGFLYGRIKKYSFARSLQTAVAAGTVNALSLKPGAVNRRQLMGMISKVKFIQLFDVKKESE